MHTGIDLILELRKRVIAFHILAGFQRGERKRGETKVDFDFFLFSEKQKEDSIWFKLQTEHLMSFRNGKLIVGSHSGSLFVAYYWLNHALFFFQKYFLRYISLWGNDQIILKRP